MSLEKQMEFDDASRIDPARYRALQLAFIAQRKAAGLMQHDIAARLSLDTTTVSNAERESGYVWPRYFQRQRNIVAYLGEDATPSAQLALERQVLETFYPGGVQSLTQLVKCIAYKWNLSLRELGDKLEIAHFKEKINDNLNNQLTPVERGKLHAYLSAKISRLGYLGFSDELLDKLLPEPLVDLSNQESFSATLNRWALLATNSDIQSFAREVSVYSGRNYLPKSVYEWGKGTGLATALPYIIQALESNPNTREIFARHKDSFLAQAEERLPAKTGGNLSEQLLKAPTLGGVLTALEKRLTNPLTEAEILQAFHEYFGCDYSPEDYAQWKQGALPKDPAFGGRLTEIIVARLHEKSGTWVTLDAREHIRKVAGPVDVAAQGRWATALSQLDSSARGRG